MRNTKLNELLRPNDDEAAVQLKMLAVLAKQRADIDKLLLHALASWTRPTPMAMIRWKLSTASTCELLPHARVVLSIWKDSLSARPATRQSASSPAMTTATS